MSAEKQGEAILGRSESRIPQMHVMASIIHCRSAGGAI
jgi:hypothetical protein